MQSSKCVETKSDAEGLACRGCVSCIRPRCPAPASRNVVFGLDYGRRRFQSGVILQIRCFMDTVLFDQCSHRTIFRECHLADFQRNCAL